MKSKTWIKKAGGRIWQDIRSCWQFAAVFLLYDIAAHLCFGAFCPSVIVAGIPCPGCGMTRAVLFFATGEFERGWHMNPLGLGWLLLLIYFCVMRYGLGKKAKGILQLGGCLVFLMVLFYCYRMYCYFPGDPPVSYTPGNLLEKIIPGYRHFILHLRG